MVANTMSPVLTAEAITEEALRKTTSESDLTRNPSNCHDLTAKRVTGDRTHLDFTTTALVRTEENYRSMVLHRIWNINLNKATSEEECAASFRTTNGTESNLGKSKIRTSVLLLSIPFPRLGVNR